MRERRQSALAVIELPTHLPLRRLALCLDCEACFEIGGPACPACGSETWCSLARFFDLQAGNPMGSERAQPRQLIVVAQTRVRLYERLRRAFAGNSTVQVVLDRRFGERRRSQTSRTPDRRIQDRRRGPGERDLQTQGWMVVRRPGLGDRLDDFR